MAFQKRIGGLGNTPHGSMLVESEHDGSGSSTLRQLEISRFDPSF